MIEEKMPVSIADKTRLPVCPYCKHLPQWGVIMEDINHTKLVKKFRLFCEHRDCVVRPETDPYSSQDLAKSAWENNFYSMITEKRIEGLKGEL